jgi:DNA-binding CsgD family transcriptional regulator
MGLRKNGLALHHDGLRHPTLQRMTRMGRMLIAAAPLTRLWKDGWTLHEIGHLFDRRHTSIQGILSRTGGIRPPDRRRSLASLSLDEREEISRALVTGESIRSIAARLGRAPSTVSRELKRNGGQESYRATQGDSAAWDRVLQATCVGRGSGRARSLGRGLGLRQWR